MMKSGTHLVNELLVALGYGMYGHVRVSEQTRPALDPDTRWRLAVMVYGPESAASLKEQPEPAFNDATDRAWEALGWAWQARLGIPLANLYGTELIETGLAGQAYRRTAGSSFAETPAGTCWVFHEFDLKKIDGNFLKEWSQTGEPRIIFNYRDPRDTIVSLVNFLCRRTRQGLSSFSNLQVYSDILLAMPSQHERLTFALTDASFPCQASDFERMAWLLHHPDVCKVSFEELVGPHGGGSARAQADSAARLIDFLGAGDVAGSDVAGTLYNRNAFSFYQGQIGAWQDAFTAEHRRIADEKLAGVLALYGYR